METWKLLPENAKLQRGPSGDKSGEKMKINMVNEYYIIKINKLGFNIYFWKISFLRTLRHIRCWHSHLKYPGGYRNTIFELGGVEGGFSSSTISSTFSGTNRMLQIRVSNSELRRDNWFTRSLIVLRALTTCERMRKRSLRDIVGGMRKRTKAALSSIVRINQYGIE